MPGNGLLLLLCTTSLLSGLALSVPAASLRSGESEVSDVPWYHNAVVYQLYPRSFKDTDGDGIGDLKGVLEKIDYLASLNIDAVWFSPVYPSPNEDFGYDISDYCDVNPEYGTLEDFDLIIAQLKARGIKVILDFVPNHSSTEHKWFKMSEIKNDTGKYNYTGFYVWKDPKGYDRNGKPIPPNNWLGVINTGSAWEWNEKRQQFYLHNFLTHQADLNYANPQVVEQINEVLKFWMRRGVAGFRVDAISWVWEDQNYWDEPKSQNYNPNKPNEYSNLDHFYTMDLPENIEIVEGWRKTMDEFTNYMGDFDERLMMLESYSDINKLISYYGTAEKPGATFPFNFMMVLDLNWASSPQDWQDKINGYFKAIGSHWTNWVLGNHDQFRVANRWSPEWVDVLNMLLMTLKGTAISYYGEEIGLSNSIVRWDQNVDVQGKVAGEKDFPTRSRDFERGPMPWDDSHLGGFTNGSSTWIPMSPDYWHLNVKAQQEADWSHLKVYSALAMLRKDITLTYGDCEVRALGTIIYVIRSQKDNPTYITMANIGDQPATGDLHGVRNGLPSLVRLLVASTNFPQRNLQTLDSSDIWLPAKSAIVVAT